MINFLKTCFLRVFNIWANIFKKNSTAVQKKDPLIEEICNKYEKIKKQNILLHDKIKFYEEELNTTQTMLIKYVDDNLKMRIELESYKKII